MSVRATPALPTLLVTGFEPFGGSAINPSSLLLPRLSAPSGWHLITRVLPVDTARLAPVLEDLLETSAPALVVALGEARGTAAFRVETTARNRLEFSLADNAGARVRGVAIVPDGPACLPATLDVDATRDCLRSLGMTAEFSDDAGGFLCNQLFYSLCHRYQGERTQVGFLHLPSLPEQGFGRGLELHAQTMAVQAVLELLAEGRTIRD